MSQYIKNSPLKKDCKSIKLILNNQRKNIKYFSCMILVLFQLLLML
jgi:hypothetical protein